DVERGDELDVAHVVVTEDDMHEPGDRAVGVGVLVVLHTLDQGGGAVADSDDPYSYRTHRALLTPVLRWAWWTDWSGRPAAGLRGTAGGRALRRSARRASSPPAGRTPGRGAGARRRTGRRRAGSGRSGPGPGRAAPAAAIAGLRGCAAGSRGRCARRTRTGRRTS